MLIDNLGTSAIISASVTGDGGSELLDNGVILSRNSQFDINSQGIILGVASTVGTGEFQVTAGGLSKSTLYYFRAYSFNANGVTYGEIKSFETSNVTFSPYRTRFRPDVPADIVDWYFGGYTGHDEDGEDPIWFNDDVGTTCITAYTDGDDFIIISPLVRVANAADVLGFSYDGAWYFSQTILKVYITEDLNNYGEPVRDWTFDSYTDGETTEPMAPYLGRSIYVVFVLEAGDCSLWNFSIAPPAP